MESCVYGKTIKKYTSQIYIPELFSDKEVYMDQRKISIVF